MSCCWCILKMISLIAFLKDPRILQTCMCVCELREWSDRGAGDAEVRLCDAGSHKHWCGCSQGLSGTVYKAAGLPGVEMWDSCVGLSEGFKWKHSNHKEFWSKCLLSSESSDLTEFMTLSPWEGQDYGHLWSSVFLAGFACKLVIGTQALGTAIVG